MKGCLTAVLVLGAVAFVCVSLFVHSAIKDGAKRKSEPQPKADPVLQAERKAYLQDVLMGPGGPFEKIDGGVMPKLWVRPAWYALTYDQKREAATAAYCYTFEIPRGAKLTWEQNGHQTLYMFDLYSGKEIGRFTYTGLELE